MLEFAAAVRERLVLGEQRFGDSYVDRDNIAGALERAPRARDERPHDDEDPAPRYGQEAGMAALGRPRA